MKIILILHEITQIAFGSPPTIGVWPRVLELQSAQYYNRVLEISV